MRRFLSPAVVALFVSSSAFAQGDPDVVAKIIDEGKTNSQVWERLLYLSEDIGTRLTGSSNLERANTWTRDTFASYGLKNAHLDKWGEIPVRFDRGPSWAKMTEPTQRDFEFTARSWSAGTDGPVIGPVVKAPTTMEELEAAKDSLAGAWVLTRSSGRRRRGDEADAAEELNAAIDGAGILGRLSGTRNDLVITSSERGWRELDMANLPTKVSVSIRRGDYDALNSLISDGETPIVEVNLTHYFTEGPFPVFNTVAEIPGTEFPEQVVICSAHLDTWDGPGSMGTQDNGTGSSVMLEAARILMASGAKPRRTIRFCLWTGEEQGLLGSRDYVERLDDEERANISAAFVDDGGTNYQGGLVCIASMEEMLNKATAPVNEAFPEMPVLNVVRDNMPMGGGSDHAAFNRVGIPGFFWIEKGTGGREEKNYRFIHHTQHDTPRYAVEEYLIQSATCMAVTAYNLSMADDMLPRQPQEEPEPPKTIEASAEVEKDAAFEVVETPATGKWAAELTGDQAPPFSFELETAKDGRVRGSIESEIGGGKISNGKWDAD